MPLGTEVDLDPGDIVLDGDPAPLKGGHSTPSFWPKSIVAKRSPISDTAELLLTFFGRNVTDKVGIKTCFNMPHQITCTSALPGKTRKHENHICTQMVY